MSRLNSNNAATPLKQLATRIGTELRNQGSALVPSNMAKNMVSLESLSDTEVQQVVADANSLGAVLRGAFTDVGAENNLTYNLTRVQEEAAVIAASAYADPNVYRHAARNVSTEGISMPASSGTFGSLNFRENKDAFQLSLEAFDNMELQKGIDVSVVFNALAVGQSPFNDEWFPVVVGTPDEVVFRINIPRILVQNEYVMPDQSGDPANFKKQNLIRAALDYTILMNNSTQIVPIVRGSANADKFVDAAAVAPYIVKVGAVEVTTAPLRPNVEHSLLNLSANEALKLAGAVGETDAIEPKVSLDEIFISATKGDDTSVMKIKVKNLPKAGFTRPMEGNVRDMRLTFDTKALRIAYTRTDVAGAEPAALSDLVANKWTLVLGTDVNGKINLETSNEKTFASGVDVVGLMDEDGKLVDLTTGAGKAFVDAVTFDFIGYTLDARRTNSNLRTKGLILNPDMESRPYYVPLNAPIVSQTPIGQESLGLDLNALVQGVHMQIENNAVTTLLEFEQTLADWFVSTETIDLYPSFEAPGELLVAPFYDSITIDMVEALNSTSSANKVNDIQGVLASALREVVARMCRETGYEVALRANNGGTVENPNIIAVTDLVLPKYLIVSGDDRYLGANTTFSVTSVNDLRMRDTIYLSFGRKATGKHDPLTFGNMLYIPELAISTVVNRNGATIFERQVQPRFRHICNLPILIKVKVERLEEASQSAAVYKTKDITPVTE